MLFVRGSIAKIWQSSACVNLWSGYITFVSSCAAWLLFILPESNAVASIIASAGIKVHYVYYATAGLVGAATGTYFIGVALLMEIMPGDNYAVAAGMDTSLGYISGFTSIAVLGFL